MEKDNDGYYYTEGDARMNVEPNMVFFTSSLSKVVLFDALDKCSTNEEAIAVLKDMVSKQTEAVTAKDKMKSVRRNMREARKKK